MGFLHIEVGNMMVVKQKRLSGMIGKKVSAVFLFTSNFWHIFSAQKRLLSQLRNFPFSFEGRIIDDFYGLEKTQYLIV